MRFLISAGTLLLLVVLAGCGGGGGGAVNPPGDGGIVTGQLTGAGDATTYTMMLNGVPLSTRPNADGTFRLTNLPPGNHSLSLVAANGMAGAHVRCVVVAGQVTNVGVVQPVFGGQIVGIVSQVDENGNLSPLEGVTVLADSQPDYIIMGGGGGNNAAIWPPPRSGDGIQLRAMTNSNGSYRMEAVAPGSYVVTVNVPGLEQGVAWVYVSAGSTAVADFQLREVIDPGVGTLRGTIMGLQANGIRVPLEGAMVSVTSQTPWQPEPPTDPIPMPRPALGLAQVPGLPDGVTGIMPPPYWFREFSTLTDAQGNYNLNVPSGYLSLSVWLEGFEGVWESLTLRAGQTLVRNYTLNPWQDFPRPEPLPVR